MKILTEPLQARTEISMLSNNLYEKFDAAHVSGSRSSFHVYVRHGRNFVVKCGVRLM